MRLFSGTLQRPRLAVRPCAALPGLGGGKPRGGSPPSRLLSVETAKEGEAAPPKTVYTVRLSTGQRRGAALSDYNSGVQLCLIGADGSGFMHRVPPLHDPEEIERDLHRICQEVDHKAGANCFVAFDSMDEQKKQKRPLTLKHRFLEGSVDEVSFLAPEMGELRGLLVGPEAGRWYCDEIDVYSSRTGHIDRFICREYLGEQSEHPAALLAPISPDAVVYGSGDSAVVLSKEQASQLYSLNMEQYGDLKARLMAINAGLVALGTAAIFAHSGGSLAAPFALGGASGMVYQLLLQADVESVGPIGAARKAKAQEVKPGLGLLMQLALANPTVRSALKAGGVVGSFFALHTLSMQSGVGGEPGGELKQILAAFAGFLMFKWAIIGAAMMPSDQGLSEALSGLGGRDKSKVDEGPL